MIFQQYRFLMLAGNDPSVATNAFFTDKDVERRS
jgi:hypothetical protein